MGTIQNSLDRMFSNIMNAVTGFSDMTYESYDDVNIDIQMREKALKQAQEKIEAITSQQLTPEARKEKIKEGEDR